VRKLFFISLFSFICFWACDEEEVARFRGSQVSRLLTSGSQAGWLPLEIIDEGRSVLSVCSDSIGYYFVLESDSVEVRQLIPRCDGTSVFDTIGIGKAYPSVQDEIFSDSLIFDDGRFWLIEEIFSQQMTFKEGETSYSLSRQ